MEQTNVQKLAKVLRWLVALAFVCNIIALYFVPAIVLLSPIELFQGFRASPVDPFADSAAGGG